MKFCRKLIPVVLVLGILLNMGCGYALSISARGGFVLNADTCQEVYSYQGDTPMVPASMTKVMSVYVIYDAMAKGQISKDTMIPVGSSLAAFSRDPGYSNVILSAGASYSLDEMLGAIFVVSANAAVMAVGDYLYGSESAFVDRMNQFVADWGIDAYFADCTGISSRNRVTPRAMATIANRLISDYPDCLNYSGMTYLNFRGQTYYATNKMLPGRAYAYDGTLGLKTGTTSAAGACFTGVVERNGVRLISVIMGAPYADGRYTDSIAMLDYAFSQPAAQAQPEIEPEPEKPEVLRNITNTGTLADANVYINDLPIADFICTDNPALTLIRVEDLRENGFEVTYEPDTNTLVVVNAPEKLLTGHDPSQFPAVLSVSGYKAVNVLLKQTQEDLGVYAAAVYDADGQAAIDVSELSYLGWVLQKDGKATVVTR